MVTDTPTTWPLLLMPLAIVYEVAAKTSNAGYPLSSIEAADKPPKLPMSTALY